MVYAIGGKLCHHGVMGQKWGKRNGPPYPLKPEAHSDREKKFGYKKSIGGGRNEEAYEKNRKKVNRVEKKNLNTQGGYKEERSMHKALKKGNARDEILKQLDSNTKREIADLRDKFEKASQEQEAAQQKILESLNKYNDDSHITQKMWDEMDRADEAANKAYEDLNKKMESASSKLLGKRAKKDINTGSGKKKASAVLWDSLADIDSNDLRSDLNSQGSVRKQNSKKKGMTDKQKKVAKGVAIGVGVAVATVAAVYVYKKYGKGALKSPAAKKVMSSTVKSSASNINTGKQYVEKVADVAKKAPELKFDVPKAASSADDSLARLMKNSQKFYKEAKSSTGAAKKYADVGDDLVEALLKKNRL